MEQTKQTNQIKQEDPQFDSVFDVEPVDSGEQADKFRGLRFLGILDVFFMHY